MKKHALKVAPRPDLPTEHVSVAQSELDSSIPHAEYQPLRPKQFPNLPAWLWFYRKHKKALIEADALLIVNRRPMVIPSRVDAVVLKVGREVARAAA